MLTHAGTDTIIHVYTPITQCLHPLSLSMCISVTLQSANFTSLFLEQQGSSSTQFCCEQRSYTEISDRCAEAFKLTKHRNFQVNKNSCTAADMETITPNYYNARFNLKAMVDWIPLRLTVTMVRSEEWIDPESKGNCVGAE